MTMPAEDVKDRMRRAHLSAEVPPPRVLLVTEHYLPEVGGTITWFENVYRRRPGGTVWILTRDYPRARDCDRREPGISIRRLMLRRHRFLRPESLLIYLKLFLSTLWVAARRRIDVLHAGKVLPEGLVTRVVGKILRTPYVVYAHGEEITILRRNPVYGKYLGSTYNGAARVVANGRFTAGLLREVGCEGGNIVRISPGVDPSFFRPGARDDAIVRELGLEGRVVLLSVGRLTKRKGHDHVIRALPEILAGCPELVYVVLSSGEEEESLRSLAKGLGVSEAVRFVGEAPSASLPRYYNTADIFILANRTLSSGDVEGFGIVFLEASACGKPVIAGDSGGTGDPVRDGWNGLRIDARDPRNIARAVIELARDPALRQRLGRNGRSMVEAEYAWDRVAEGTWEMDLEVVAERGRGLAARGDSAGGGR